MTLEQAKKIVADSEAGISVPMALLREAIQVIVTKSFKPVK